MKKKEFKGFVLGFALCALLVAMASTALAVGSTQTLKDVKVGGIRIVIDGQELHPTDAGGKAVSPMIYNGTTYLPVRAVASALGKAVYWDGPSYTVYLGDMDGQLEYPTVMLKDMTNIGTWKSSLRSQSKLADNYGNTYGSALYFDYWEGGTSEYLLNMKYSRFRGTLYVPKGVSSDYEAVLTITADGRQIYSSPVMTKASQPAYIDVNVTGCNDFKIEWGKYSDDILSLADAGFYQ